MARGRQTCRDCCATSEDERYELLDGDLVMTPSKV